MATGLYISIGWIVSMVLVFFIKPNINDDMDVLKSIFAIIVTIVTWPLLLLIALAFTPYALIIKYKKNK